MMNSKCWEKNVKIMFAFLFDSFHNRPGGRSVEVSDSEQKRRAS